MKVINTLFFRATLVLVLVSVYFTIYSKISFIEIKFSTDAEDLNVLYTSTDIHIYLSCGLLWQNYKYVLQESCLFNHVTYLSRVLSLR
jgi:hypothetical protein